jgi:hypothetical protein
MVLQLILGLILVIIILSSVGIGGEIFDDIAADVREDKAKQKDVIDPAIINIGNFASDTGTRICDLELTFYGTVTPYNPITLENIPLRNDEDALWLWHGDVQNTLDVFALLFGNTIADDTRIVTYEWFCSNVNVSAASVFWNLRQNTLELFGNAGNSQVNPSTLSLISNIQEGVETILGPSEFAETGGETIRLFFQAESLNNNGKLMIDKFGFGPDNKPFQASQTLPVSSPFPYNYVISLRLQDVTEDDYLLSFWSDDYEQNNKQTGFRFTYFICSPLSQATNTIGTVTGKTIFGETVSIDINSASVAQGC